MSKMNDLYISAANGEICGGCKFYQGQEKNQNMTGFCWIELRQKKVQDKTCGEVEVRL
jgi:hypothetical protein